MAKLKDLFVNKAYCGVTMSAANTLTFDQIQTGVSMFDRLAWIIHRIRYIPTMAAWAEIAAEADRMDLAIVTADTLTTLAADQANVLDVCRIMCTEIGTSASGMIHKQHVDVDFNDMPSGGLLVPANTIYLGMVTTAFSAAVGANAVIYFTYKKLTDAEYIELVQAMQVVT